MMKTYLLMHMIAFGMGFFLDLLIGDPHWLYHPVRFIGHIISVLQKATLEKTEADDKNKQVFYGVMTVIAVLFITGILAALLLIGAYLLDIRLGVVIETLMTYQILATKSLRKESMKVYKELKNGTLQDARKALSMIVGRDTDVLDEEGIIKASVETVAENTSDGVIAPMICLAIGGPIAGFLYKAVNTMDSMIGYKNDKFLYYGRAAAKLDDHVNFLPSRISALYMIVASFIGGKEFSAGNAYAIFKRDRFNHSSPNSAQTEAVCAGALGVRLAGDASYFGKVVKKSYIGDEGRKIEAEDIKRVNKLMYISAFLCMITFMVILEMICFVIL